MAGIDDRVIGRDAFKEAASCPVGHLLVDIEHAIPSGLSDLGRVDEGVAHQDGMLSLGVATGSDFGRVKKFHQTAARGAAQRGTIQ